MLTLVKERTTAKRGGIIELHSSRVPAGATVQVSAIIEFQPLAPPPLASMIGKLKGLYTSSAQADDFLRSQREDWES